MKSKHKAGYYSENVNKETLNFIKSVIQERKEEVVALNKSEIIKQINDMEKEDE